MERGLYSPNGAHPQELPDYWKFSDGTVRTDLRELTDEKLENLGWFGPVQMPPFPGTTYYTHEYTWNSESISYDVRELTENEIAKKVDYRSFWNSFINTSTYAKIKATASQSLSANTLVTEFIAVISDAKINNDYANINKIQELLFEIFENISFTEEELTEIQTIFNSTGMSAIYTLEPPSV